jgi:hypothetical protein
MHVDGSIDPLRDMETIQIELIFADLEVVEKRIPKIQKRAQMKTDAEAVIEYAILEKLKASLENQQPIRQLQLSQDEERFIRNFSFLTAKPMIYVLNVSESEMADYSKNPTIGKIMEIAKGEHAEVTIISAKIEQELSELSLEDKAMFLEELGVPESGLDDLIRKSYRLLGLETFFTAGEKEVRSWTFKRGMKAPECAGVIHSDFEKGFIRAETIAFTDLVAAGSEAKAKEQGKYRLEGKEYGAKDGDVFFFRFHV